MELLGTDIIHCGWFVLSIPAGINVPSWWGDEESSAFPISERCRALPVQLEVERKCRNAFPGNGQRGEVVQEANLKQRWSSVESFSFPYTFRLHEKTFQFLHGNTGGGKTFCSFSLGISPALSPIVKVS